MKVYIIDPKITMLESTKATCFFNVLKEEFGLYGIDFTIVNKINTSRCISNINNNSIVILFNDNNDTLIYENGIDKFLCNAKKTKAKIWPVAMDKEKRIPPKIILDKQSYDVEEQLRARDMKDDYIPFISKVFARKIIAEILPTLYRESGLIFISHRRIDGEEITAKLCDKILQQFKESNAFRDVTSVKVGDDAQQEIDKAMAESDIFIFIHTPKVIESEWIMKELQYAILRNIPILWIQIDNADPTKLKIKPTEQPHLHYLSENFENTNELAKITDEILQKGFELIMTRTNIIFDYSNKLKEIFEDKLSVLDDDHLHYNLNVKRKGYRYPQRNINQYVKLFGRMPTEKDKTEYLSFLDQHESKYDSAIFLTDRIVSYEQDENIIIETYYDFFYHWKKYLNCKNHENNQEIIISGAFPNGDEMHKQTLTDALIFFCKTILRANYKLTFGSHPTFQELFFSIAKQECPENYNQNLKMYISQYFDYSKSREYYKSNAQLLETPKGDDQNSSLHIMRKEMIQRNEVAALICLGGKVKNDPSKEGIREEIQLANEFNIPIFIVGSVGGCSSVVASEYKANNWKDLKQTSVEINNELSESTDFITLSEKIIKYLSKKTNNNIYL